ncbi:type II toxin-antitoxin system death-on-curing family toxin [Lacticaseibacillus camelliae]|uniref:Fido domain-containing protein n=1 Tax=Lacticaseibacillus camelliae DSM 22697 = JCM 13995 TaxID=1423730 RepID=A0A0R2FAF2_9LACO|nr:type II toxin-antitoxin system death-on-curing family toxin [Lacticaseibacillus camelliae]KRN25336.1 hypothetical protein FC75_GL000698 [Lacticaseibacillus camelliae DSM 22697 = JCM 13995]
MKYLSQSELITINVCLQQEANQRASIRDAKALDYIVRSAHQDVFGQQLYANATDLAIFYFVKLIKKHVFNDGNKRTAYLSFLDCLALNHITFKPDSAQRRQLAELAIHVARVDGEPQSLWNEVKAIVQEMLIK